MGLWDSITDAVDDIGDAVSDAAESAYDTVADGGIGKAVAWAADGVDRATFGLAGRALEATDDYVFDTVDYVTGGAINVDFDGGRFTVGAGFDGLAHVGAGIGESGISAEGTVPGASFDIASTDHGFTANGSAGIDFGPLPYAEGHLAIDDDGNVMVNGHVQGTIPTPYGLLSGQATGGFVRTDDGWGASLDADGTLYTPSGAEISAGVNAAYEETAEGSHTSIGVEGSVSMDGIEVGGAVGYERIEQGDDVVEGFHAEGHVDALGVRLADAEADYTHTDIDGVEHSDWSGDIDVNEDAVGALVQAGIEQYASPIDDPAPMDDFSQDIDTADDMQSSLESLTDDLDF